MKLSKRLRQLEQLVTDDYDHIWDCCCDHGFLGASLLTRQTSQTIHFVDIVPELMTKIEKQLQTHHAHSSWQTHCLDVAELPLHQYQGKQLIIIAGIGGDLMSRMIKAIKLKHPNLVADFLLCSVHRQYALRQQLIELKFSLRHEILLEDKRRFYEVMLVSSVSDETAIISPVGEVIWQSENHKQAAVVSNYLENTLNYYRRFQQIKSDDINEIISAYESVKQSQ